jgi:glutamyl/glutaminyl-tRNA synthetase
LHHPLVLNPTGQKLSKSEQAAAIREMRRAGLDAHAVIGAAEAALEERPPGF